MSFEILSAEGCGAARWSVLIAALAPELRDIHFLPEYGRIYRDTYGQEPFLAVCEDGSDAVLQPFVRRPLAELPFLDGAPDGPRFSDIANPYGYGGPLSTASDPAAARRLYRRLADGLAEWCARESIASEFTSLHPLLVGHQLPMLGGAQSCRHQKDVVVVDLAGGRNDLWGNIRKGHRSSVRLAERAGAHVARVEPSARNLALFNEMYYATMTRRSAAPRWFFPENYFAQCVEHLGPCRTSLFFSSLGEQVESACLLMHDFAIAYYHFAATRAEHPELGTNNLMVYEAAIWAQGQGYKSFHLGGGVGRGEDDGLFRFKAGFSPGRAPLYTYFGIRDRAAYDDLSGRKRGFELATTGAEFDSDFLPLYRR
jgi:hypothetical protein